MVELEQIIRSELRPTVELLVRKIVVELVHESMSGASVAVDDAQVKGGATKTVPASPVRPETKTCRSCGETKPLSEFGHQHGTCAYQARHKRERVAAQPAGADSPHPFPVA
jgi:hypothetical protein